MNTPLRYLMCPILLLQVLLLQAQVFTAHDIPDSIWTRMQGRSYPQECGIARSELCYLELSHYDFNGEEHIGQMVCNRQIAEDLLYIFSELYKVRYPIARMRLIDDYEASDLRSMADNNTSCFCYRHIAGSKNLSRHSRGMAVDVNPLYNPCLYVRSGRVLPPEGKAYAHDRDRRKDIPGKIDTADLCYRLFVSRGFRWGGAWRTLKDYQHFER